jgi:hypothetical protein
MIPAYGKSGKLWAIGKELFNMRRSLGEYVFDILNVLFLSLLVIVTIYPLL